VWNYLNHRCQPAPHGASAPKPINLAVLGGGSAGSSTVGILSFIDQMGKGHNYLEGDAIPNVVPNPWFHAARLESAGFIERSTNALPVRTAPYVPTTVLKQLMEMIGPLLAE
jgi:hypothetical protein